MHLTGFMLFTPAPHTQLSWVYPPEKIRHQWHETEYWEEIARTLEEGLFDAFFFADGWGGGGEDSIRWAIQFPTHDPLLLLSRLSAVTDRLGLASTLSTTFYPPYMLARKLATLDHITKGRVGWNVVTSIHDGEARNFGMTLPPHDERYDRADEYMELVDQLWSSWDPDAVVMDMDTPLFADPEKVHRIDFEGRWYSSTGPLNVLPSPQRRPVIFQAGASDRGRDFAARWADCVFAFGGSPARTREFRADLEARMERHGRDPSDLQVIEASIPEAIEICGEQLLFFYAWQNAPGKEQLPGLGPVDCTPWLEALARIDYRGHVNPFMHGHPEPEEMTAALAASKAYLEACRA